MVRRRKISARPNSVSGLVRSAMAGADPVQWRLFRSRVKASVTFSARKKTQAKETRRKVDNLRITRYDFRMRNANCGI